MAAIVNAVWDLWAKAEGKPVWKLLADMTPRQIVSCIDFAYITDALTPDEALEILERHARSHEHEREAELTAGGYPAYTTSAGWIGYSDDGVQKPGPRGARRWMDTLQGQGRRTAGRRSAPGRARARRRSDRNER